VANALISTTPPGLRSFAKKQAGPVPNERPNRMIFFSGIPNSLTI